jgi:DNA helicase-2/ATP-dependent DNA helicase PcrA
MARLENAPWPIWPPARREALAIYHSARCSPMTHEDFQKDLNAEQYAAVSAPDGPVLVIAAAGTGKTRTLTYRVAWLVRKGVEPQRILLLTFTNRAAREMLDRAVRLVGDSVSGIWGGTFHHMANRILRRHADQLGYRPDYTILDQDDARSLVRECMEAVGEKPHIPKPEVLQSVFSLAANRSVSVEDVALERFGEHGRVSLPDILAVYAAYTARKRELNAMDFDDLLVNALTLFREHPDVQEYYQQHFEYVLVDEYQDTNSLQSDWVDLLAGRKRNLFVVGDDFQSIYSWRGADFQNILSFPKRYPDARVYMLETNYRSVPGILDVANACIAGNPEQFQKKLRPVREGEEKPQLFVVPSADSQTQLILRAVQEFLQQGYTMKDIVVLYRAHYHAMELQLALTRERVPFVITSGMRFFEQAHVKDACSLLRLWVNPADELAFLRLLALLPKVGVRTAAQLWANLGKHCNLRDADVLKRVQKALPGLARDDWTRITAALPQNEEETPKLRAGDMIVRFVNKFYDEFLVENYENYDRRREDLIALADYAGRYDSSEEFLNEMALLTNLDAEIEDLQAADNDVLRLSTVHQAKGLEWKVVFLLWMVDGMFPSSRSLAEQGEGEERRLFYVAVTRARDHLVLCMPSQRTTRDGGAMPCLPSRFINELPAGLLKVRQFWG